jgi:surface carbohydrate biosynthesis protein
VNIHLKMEVRARELEGRLLLALVAAERGHDVLLGDLRTLLSHRLFLRPGIYHDKSLTPAPRKLAFHARLADAGFAVTSQDEEHGLIEPSYDAFARQRFSDASLAQAHLAFAWGEHDGSALERLFPDQAHRVRITGSPRVDLWRPEFGPLHADLARPGVTPDRPYVLVASSASPLDANPFWIKVRTQRPAYFPEPDDPAQYDLYEHYAREFAYLGRLVRAVRLLAARAPDLTVVVRPHPTEADGAWHDLLGPIPNVVVSREGGIGRWIRGAVAVVHNGSTVALEAAVSGVPVISFQPDGDRADLVTNRLGRAARDEEALARLVTEARDPAARSTWSGPEGQQLLTTRLAALDGRLAADRIVDAWEGLDPHGLSSPTPIRTAQLIAGLHRRAGAIRRAVTHPAAEARPFVTGHKFPPLTRREVDALVAGQRRCLDRFHRIEVSLIGPRLIRVRPRR